MYVHINDISVNACMFMYNTTAGVRLQMRTRSHNMGHLRG